MEEIGLQINDLRGDRQDILAEATERADPQTRMNDIIAFLEEIACSRYEVQRSPCQKAGRKDYHFC